MTKTQSKILESCYKKKLNIRQICSKIKMGYANIHRHIEILAKEGMVKLEEGGKGKARTVFITEKGKVLLMKDDEFKEPCLICGTKNKLTEHHLGTGKKISLCRPCHDEVEEAKVCKFYQKSRAERKSVLQVCEEALRSCGNNYEHEDALSNQHGIGSEGCDYEQHYDEKLVDKALKTIGRVK